MCKTILNFFISLMAAYSAASQTIERSNDVPEKNRFSVVFGLNQPLVFHGFNIEANCYTRKWVFDYSHGFDLTVKGSMLGNEYNEQKLNFKIAHSFGAGIGYRFTRAFNLRLEPKIHVYQTYYAGENKTVKSNSIANFNTYTLGLGAYYRWLPFENKRSILKGLTVVPSVRYWQKVGSSLDNNRFTYNSSATGKTEMFKAPNIGLSNTPFLFNISIGYSF